jgi:hypothetical protein
VALALALCAARAEAFVVFEPPAHRFHMSLALGDEPFPSLGYGVQSWNALAELALGRWNGVGVGVSRDHAFFSSTRSAASDDLCERTGVNQVAFADRFCGRSLGDAVAITRLWIGADDTILEADVVFNTSYTFNAYGGPLRRDDAARSGVSYDIYRVLLHEFGHVIGLDHPDDGGQQVLAIMNRRVSDIADLQPDDIAGAHALAWGEPILDQFVAGFYTSVLGRTPSPAEVAAWAGFLRGNPAGASAIVQGFFHSPEFLTTRRGTIADYVTALYATVLLRAPSQDEIDAWVPLIVARFNRLVPGFVGSWEFQAVLRSTPPAAVVERLYRRVLGRTPTAAEVSAWVAALERSGDWHGVAIGFLDSPEYLDSPRTFAEHVELLYATFLDRAPSAAEVTAWLDVLVGHLDEIEAAFTASPEFQHQIAGLFL